MVQAWVHTVSNHYWNGYSVPVLLPYVPRIGETIYLSQDTVEQLIVHGELQAPARYTGDIQVFTDLLVTDVCYFENEENIHIMVTIGF